MAAVICVTNKYNSIIRFCTAEVAQNGNAHGTQTGGQNANHSMVNQPASGALGGVRGNLNIATSASIPAMRGHVSSTLAAGGMLNDESVESMWPQILLQVLFVLLLLHAPLSSYFFLLATLFVINALHVRSL